MIIFFSDLPKQRFFIRPLAVPGWCRSVCTLPFRRINHNNIVWHTRPSGRVSGWSENGFSRGRNVNKSRDRFYGQLGED